MYVRRWVSWTRAGLGGLTGNSVDHGGKVFLSIGVTRRKIADEFQRLSFHQEVADFPLLLANPLKEPGYRPSENEGNYPESASCYPVHPLLVFLDLLEGQADVLPKFALAHADQRAAGFHSSAHVDINGTRPKPAHCV